MKEAVKIFLPEYVEIPAEVLKLDPEEVDRYIEVLLDHALQRPHYQSLLYTTIFTTKKIYHLLTRDNGKWRRSCSEPWSFIFRGHRVSIDPNPMGFQYIRLVDLR